MSKRILIVDGDVQFRNSLAEVFSQAGYTVEACGDGDAALRFQAKEPFPLIIVEMKLAGMSGLELINKISTGENPAETIVVSGSLDVPMVRQLINSGVDGIFIKPLNLFALLKRVNAIFAKMAIELASAGNPTGADAAHATIFQQLGFKINSFPCKSELTISFAKGLYARRDFKANLLVIGEDGSNFEGICRDLVSFQPASEREGFVIFDQKNFDPRRFSDEFHKLVLNQCKRVTFAVISTSLLTPPERAAILAMAKKEGDFKGYPLPIRCIFCLTEDVDTLYERGELDESLYIFLGTSEIRVPALRDSPEDLVAEFEHLLTSKAAATNRSRPLMLTPDARRYLRDCRGPLVWHELADIADVIVANPEVIRVGASMIRDVFSKLQPAEAAASQKMVNIREELLRRRDGYVTSVYNMLGGDAQAASRLLGIPADRVTTIVHEA